MSKKAPLALIILDGFGYRKETEHNAIAQANTPNLDTWFATYPHTLLQASGAAVGLLDGYIGNSEVGHLTIGAGRIIVQPVSIIHQAIDDGSFFSNKKLVENLEKLKQTGGSLHLMGLLSDAGVHSHEKHLYAFLKAAEKHGVENIFVHPFLDGRDTPPQSAAGYLEKLEKSGATIGSLHGRFYAMDRDNNLERTAQSYKILTESQSEITPSWQKVLEKSYAQNITDEFIPPIQLDPEGVIKNGDGVIFFNFRPDRARQLTKMFLDNLNLAFFIIPVTYQGDLNTTYLFEKPTIKNTLKDILSQNGKTIFSIAETEKYAHITHFFTGHKEEPVAGETRVLIPSIVAKNYIEHPCMSAPEITNAVLKSLQEDPHDFYLINYANADMVGHSGDMAATIKAIEYLDVELKKLYDTIVEQMGGTMIITADHGNAEVMFSETSNQPQTAHTTNPVPFLFIKKDAQEDLQLKELADIAPFILKCIDNS